MEIQELLDRVYYHNTVQTYLIALGIIVLGLLLVKAFRRFIIVRAERWTARTTTRIDDFIIDSIDRFGIPALYLGAIGVGINFLVLPGRVEDILRIAATVAFTFLAIRFVSNTLLLLLQSWVRHQSEGEEKVRQLGGIMLIINVIIWGVGLLFLFSNLGYDVTAIIAGLGVGGIAIALAAQNILGDLFNYFVIFLDRPFEVGDFVVVDDKNGVIEKIGIKTTRVKTLSGEQLVFANSDLTKSRIHNFKRMQQRRVLFRIKVTYQTAFEHIKAMPELLKSIILEQELTRFDRAHFATYGESSLEFEVVYYVLDSDYNKYMDVNQAINLRIFEEFSRREIDFAYPTRTLFVANQQGEALLLEREMQSDKEER